MACVVSFCKREIAVVVVKIGVLRVAVDWQPVKLNPMRTHCGMNGTKEGRFFRILVLLCRLFTSRAPTTTMSLEWMEFHEDQLAKRQLIYPDMFSGESSFSQWIQHFKRVTAINMWDDQTKLKWLHVRLTGKFMWHSCK